MTHLNVPDYVQNLEGKVFFHSIEVLDIFDLSTKKGSMHSAKSVGIHDWVKKLDLYDNYNEERKPIKSNERYKKLGEYLFSLESVYALYEVRLLTREKPLPADNLEFYSDLQTLEKRIIGMAFFVAKKDETRRESMIKLLNYASSKYSEASTLLTILNARYTNKFGKT